MIKNCIENLLNPFRIFILSGALIIIAGFSACQQVKPTVATLPSPSPSVIPLETPGIDPQLTLRSADYSLVTLPLIDAFLSDQTFAAKAQQQLGLTNEQMAQIQKSARQKTAQLRETRTDSYTYSTPEAHEQAMQVLRGTIGETKTQEFTKYLYERWGEDSETASATPSPAENKSPASVAKNALPTGVNNIPSDTRIVVNTPAFRMDVFKDGQLQKSYKIGIGYPEFPIPVALRKANTLIFNPTWTPPDEPWVESPSSKVKVGQTVAAGSSLNPLGPIKIPIGLPSLIHGGKTPAKLGTFASHGCVGLTDSQVREFSQMLADLSGAPLSQDELAQYARNKTETKNVKLPKTIPVELRYETIVVEDGKLHIYRDVYDRNTNSEEELRRVLQSYEVNLDDLSKQEQTQVQTALKSMARDASGKADSTTSSPSPTPATESKKDSSQPTRQSITRSIKGAKVIVIELNALKGKGYPAPVNLNTGTSSIPVATKTSKK